MKYLILALDGGGVKILLQWTILKRIIAKFPNFLDNVCVFAGTSAGSMLAGALASNKLEEINEMINIKTIASVFERTYAHEVKSLWGTLHAKYDNYNLKQILTKTFGEQKICDLPRALFIPAFAINAEDEHHANKHNLEHITNSNSPSWMNCRCKRWHNIFFHNLREKITTNSIDSTDNKIVHKNNDVILADAILKSGAAPYYFPIAGNCIDGGLAHNNPSMGVLSHLLALKVPIEDIYIFSLGSGEKPTEYVVQDNSSIGLYNWSSYLLDMIFDANMEACVHSCHEILGPRFHRESPVMSEAIALDGYKQGELLIKMGEEADLTDTFMWIEEYLKLN